MNKEKIEEILLHLDSYFEQAMGTEVTREDWVNLRKELSDLISTLIQAERKEAVEGFVDNIGWKKPSEVIDLADDVIDGRSLVKQMEAYLQSLDKGDTDENR